MRHGPTHRQLLGILPCPFGGGLPEPVFLLRIIGGTPDYPSAGGEADTRGVRLVPTRGLIGWLQHSPRGRSGPPGLFAFKGGS